MNAKELLHEITQDDECELITMDGFDDCIAGVMERFGQENIMCYNKEMVLSKMESEGMDRSEAEEFFYFNQIGAWVGDFTPCFLTVLEDYER